MDALTKYRRKISQNMTDASFLASSVFLRWLQNLAKGFVARTQGVAEIVRVKFIQNSNHVAFTDGDNVTLNVDPETNPLISGLPREEAVRVLTGVLTHELAHRWLTNFIFSATVFEKMSSEAILYPGPTNPRLKAAEEDIKNYCTDFASVKMIGQIQRYLFNILEDGRIEERCLQNNFGILSSGLQAARTAQWRSMNTIAELQEKINDYSFTEVGACMSALLQYAKYGVFKINARIELEAPFMSNLLPCLPYVDAYIAATKAAERSENANSVLCVLWPVIKDEVDKEAFLRKLCDQILKEIQDTRSQKNSKTVEEEEKGEGKPSSSAPPSKMEMRRKATAAAMKSTTIKESKKTDLSKPEEKETSEEEKDGEDDESGSGTGASGEDESEGQDSESESEDGESSEDETDGEDDESGSGTGASGEDESEGQDSESESEDGESSEDETDGEDDESGSGTGASGEDESEDQDSESESEDGESSEDETDGEDDESGSGTGASGEDESEGQDSESESEDGESSEDETDGEDDESGSGTGASGEDESEDQDGESESEDGEGLEPQIGDESSAEESPSEMQDYPDEEGEAFDTYDGIVERAQREMIDEVEKDRQEACNEMLKLLNTLITEEAEDEMAADIVKEGKLFADQIKMPNIHKGVPIKIQRTVSVQQETKDAYNVIAPQISSIVNRTAGNLERALKDKKIGGKKSNLFFGRRLDARTLYRDDAKSFCTKKLPSGDPSTAFFVLVDESGSMGWGGGRIDSARLTALVLEGVFRKLHVPFSIYGHTTYDTAMREGVLLNAYADFGRNDANDKYRIMNMADHDNNRDGAALRFAMERLKERTENTKVLLLICDGQPAAVGYSGREAERDLQSIQLELSRNGIHLIVTGIGSDEAKLKSIYGDSYMHVQRVDHLSTILPKKLLPYIKI